MAARRALLLATITAAGLLCVPRADGAAITGGVTVQKGGRRILSSPAFLLPLPGLLRPPTFLGGGRRSRAPLAAKRGGAGGGRAKGKKKGGREAPFDLEAYRTSNVEKHGEECRRMQASYNATLPHAAERRSFAESDIATITVDEGIIGAGKNQPFGSTGLIHYTKAPLFTRGECQAVIQEAEERARERGGWGTERHFSHPTTDVLLEDLPRSVEWFRESMPTKLFPFIAGCFPGVVDDPEKLRIFDVFVVKYDAERQSYLSVHRDSSLISVTVQLNSASEFDGGGMSVEALGSVVSLDQGQAVTFASNIRHGGNKITRGLRYILVGFLLYEGYVEHDRRFLEASQVKRAEGRRELAEELCRASLSENPRRQEAWNNLGCLQRDSGDLGGAARSFNTSIGIQENYQEGWVNLGACQGLRGDAEGAVEIGRHAVGINPNDATAHFNLACSLDSAGDEGGAMRHFESAIGLNSLDAEALHQRGQLSLRMGDLGGAESDLSRASALRPGEGAVLNDLGVCLYEKGDSRGALGAFERALAINPGDLQAAENAAALKQFLGE